jgi:exosortase
MANSSLSADTFVTTRQVSGRWQRGVVFFVAGLFVLLFAPTIAWLFERWTMGVWYNGHGLLIPPIVAYFMWRELRKLNHVPPSSSAWGFAILIPALVLHSLDTAIHTQLLSAASMVLALPGLSLLFLGRQRTRRILLPLLFAAFMLPIPLTLTEQIHFALREIATESTALLVRLMGIPVLTRGTALYVPGASLFVGDACSGFATLYAAVAIACLTAFGTPDWRRRAIVLLAAAPLAIGANILRVTLLVLLVWWQGRHLLAGPLHPLSGMLTFVLVLPVILWLGGSLTFRARSS